MYGLKRGDVMSMLKDSDREILKQELAGLTGPVKLINFTQQLECQYCKETGEILQELTRLSDKISIETYNFITDNEAADRYQVDKIPATIILGAEDRGIKFYGLPSGFEFMSLIEDIKMVSSGLSGLTQKTKDIIAELKKPLHIQVFVTPTWPYCPRAVALAHKLAFESPLIKADMVEIIEFPHLAMRYQLMGVPKTVINETVSVEGAVPEATLMKLIEDNFIERGVSITAGKSKP
jgi:glutaredoxin-like protein